MIVRVLFPSTVGRVVSVIRSTLTAAYSDGLKVQGELPVAAQRTKRMVTVADNSGPDDVTQTRRRYGVNVWAETAVIAEQMALLAMAGLRACPDGKPITATDSFSGPSRVDDDPPMAVSNVNLSHYFFVFRLTARGSNF